MPPIARTSRSCIEWVTSRVTSRRMATSRSRRTFRGDCCRVFRKRTCVRARSLACLLIALVLSACGGKPVTAPAPMGAPKFADFVFPEAPPTLGPQDLLDAHTRAWQFLQAGDTKAADRDFGSILKIDPGFYPAEAGLGYSAFARKDSQAAVAHFDKALTANASYAPALAGKGDALLALGKNDA